jgi:Domain of unknown function (DUF5753)/Helix-turn-helix domain
VLAFRRPTCGLGMLAYARQSDLERKHGAGPRPDRWAGDSVSAKAPDEAEDPRRRFGRLLRDARELYGPGPLTQGALARLARTSSSTISRLETGGGPIPPQLPATFDQIFKTSGRFKQLADEAAAVGFPELYRRRMELEQSAIAVWEWCPTVIPGLLQTGSYARAILRTDRWAAEAEISSTVGARLARQDLLRRAMPPDLRVVLSESVIRANVGGAEIMREQLAALVSHAERPTTRIQILPLDAEPHRLMEWPVTLLEAPNHVRVVCVESYRTASIIEEPEHVRVAVDAYDELMSEALPVRASSALISDVMERL